VKIIQSKKKKTDLFAFLLILALEALSERVPYGTPTQN
jgi:hypothetical protein